MTARGSLRVAAAVACFVAMAPAPGRAEPPATIEVGARADECASTAESAQLHRKEGRLRAARAQLLVCGAGACPAVVRADCLAWLSDLDRDLPSIVVRARDVRDHDIIGVRVRVNGEMIASELDGGAIVLDPGPYQMRYETRSGAVEDETILLRLGERQRVLVVRFAEPLKADGTADKPLAVDSGPLATEPRSVRPLIGHEELGYVFGAAALGALGAFAFLELRGQSDFHALRAGCGQTQTCPESSVDPMRREFVAADSFLAASIVFFGLSIWQFLSAPRPGRRDLRAPAQTFDGQRAFTQGLRIRF